MGMADNGHTQPPNSDISTSLGTEHFSRMTTLVPDTIPFSTTTDCWSSSESLLSTSLDHCSSSSSSFGLADEGLFGLETTTTTPSHHQNDEEQHHQQQQQQQTACVCLARALQQHEDVCINLQWAARGLTSVTPAEMLQCLKRGTEAYGELLDCRSHAHQGPLPPERISLLLSTCDMMVSGAEHLVFKRVGATAGAGAGGADSASISNGDRAVVGGGGKLHKAGGGRGGSNNNNNNKAQPSSRHHHHHQFGHLILDEEEERRLFHSLLVSRAKRLCALVERLHHVADRDGRPVHVRLIHNFRERCRTVLSTLKSQEKNNDPW